MRDTDRDGLQATAENLGYSVRAIPGWVKAMPRAVDEANREQTWVYTAEESVLHGQRSVQQRRVARQDCPWGISVTVDLIRRIQCTVTEFPPCGAYSALSLSFAPNCPEFCDTFH